MPHGKASGRQRTAAPACRGSTPTAVRRGDALKTLLCLVRISISMPADDWGSLRPVRAEIKNMPHGEPNRTKALRSRDISLCRVCYVYIRVLWISSDLNDFKDKTGGLLFMEHWVQKSERERNELLLNRKAPKQLTSSVWLCVCVK